MSYSVYTSGGAGGDKLFTRKTYASALSAARANADGTGQNRWVKGHGKKVLVRPRELTARKNPSNSLVGKWIPAIAVKQNRDGTVSVKVKRGSTRGVRRNPAPEGYSKKWYQLGFRSGVRGTSRDMYSSWKSQKGKPGSSSTDGRRIEAQESFYLGFQDGKTRKQMR